MIMLRFFQYRMKCQFSTSSQALRKASKIFKKQPKNKISLAPKFMENMKTWPKLLEAEIEAKFEKLNELIEKKIDWKIIEERGLCVGNLQIKSKYYDYYSGEVVVMTGEGLSRTRWLRSGIPVMLNKLNSDGRLEKLFEGHVVEYSHSQVKICIYGDKNADFSITNYILTPSNGGYIKNMQNILKDSAVLATDSVHLINLAYRSIPMVSINDRMQKSLPETLNSSQVAAVSAALNPKRRILCIQGPPGTGKTQVIAEVSYQLAKKKKKVLVCAPTHVAVNNAKEATARRISQELGEEEVEKYLCNLSNIKEEFQNHPLTPKLLATAKQLTAFGPDNPLYKKINYECYTLRINIFRNIFSKRRVIFTTLGTSFIQKLPEYGWNAEAIIVDEAAQCTEPATWVPVLNTPNCKKLVLVGDQNQLPAVVISEKAIKGNLRMSLMEKLAKEFSGLNINILLKEQYRMNENIMKWSNEVFYENQLTAHSSVANITLHDLCPNIPGDHPLNSPILMINTDFIQDRSREQYESRSFTNTCELEIVSEYANRLVVNLGLNPKEIAVIAPYSAQIDKIRRHIPFRVDVNTVDAFQGHERQVVIFCFVRDNLEGLIGFLGETRRLNVAITRAKRQVVLVGSGRMIEKNREFKKLFSRLQSENVIFEPSVLKLFDDIEQSVLPKSEKFHLKS